MNNIGLNFNYGKQEIPKKDVKQASQETVAEKDVSLEEVYKPENPELPKPQTKAIFKGRRGEDFHHAKERLERGGVIFEKGDSICLYDENGKFIGTGYLRDDGKWQIILND